MGEPRWPRQAGVLLAVPRRAEGGADQAGERGEAGRAKEGGRRLRVSSGSKKLAKLITNVPGGLFQ